MPSLFGTGAALPAHFVLPSLARRQPFAHPHRLPPTPPPNTDPASLPGRGHQQQGPAGRPCVQGPAPASGDRGRLYGARGGICAGTQGLAATRAATGGQGLDGRGRAAGSWAGLCAQGRCRACAQVGRQGGQDLAEGRAECSSVPSAQPLPRASVLMGACCARCAVGGLC